jgi:enoyl-CoA hydratase
MAEYEYLSLQVEGPVATVTFSRPDRMNAMGIGPWKEIHLVQDEIEANRDIRVVIIKADGPHFSVGINLNDLAGVSSDYVIDNINYLQRTYTRWQEMNAIVIAAVHGYATALPQKCSVLATSGLPPRMPGLACRKSALA